MISFEDRIQTRFSAKRLADRQVDQLLGICEGVISDGEVVQAEAEFVLEWIRRNDGSIDQWPGNVLYSRLTNYLADGSLDDNEQGELLGLLMDIGGVLSAKSKTTVSLPLCNPEPHITFEDANFVLTGTFAWGTRAECQGVIQRLGGSCGSKPSKKTDVLVIGEFVTSSWIHETFGRKIEAAVQLRADGSGIGIVCEEYWAGCLQKAISAQT